MGKETEFKVMNRKVFRLGIVFIICVMIISGCGSQEEVKSKDIYLIDYPAGNTISISLKNYQNTYPGNCRFAAKISDEELIYTIKSALGKGATIQDFTSADSVDGYLIEVPNEGNFFFQNLFSTGQTSGDLPKEYREYELNCGITPLISKNGEDVGYMLFPLVMIESKYTENGKFGESFYEDELEESYSYALKKGYTDEELMNILYNYYSKYYCYDATKIDNQHLLVSPKDDIIDQYVGEEDTGASFYAKRFCENDFILCVNEGLLTIELK